ncbi:MAG: ABC transporter ATP-binding protein [Candidatus Omnitrophota bacterium]
MKPVICLQGVSKKFKIYDNSWGHLKEFATFGLIKDHEVFWALRDIDLSVQRGETVGVIGMNGSGKSTLLQLASGILRPTEGAVSIPARIATLLELGGLFHPELSGLENVFLAAGILGYRRKEIQTKLDEVIAFADIGHFINHPVKIYSQGMFLRLAFAVVVCLDPAAVLIDEVLAVGDVLFQQKCYERIGRFAEEGKAVLLVSHNTEEIKKLTDRCVLLDGGKIAAEGNPWEVTEVYHKKLNELRIAREGSSRAYTMKAESFFTEEAELMRVRILKGEREITGNIQVGEEVEVEVMLRFKVALHESTIGIFITDLYGSTVTGTHTGFHGIKLDKAIPGGVVTARFSIAAHLKPDPYSITVRVLEYPEKGTSRTVMKMNGAAVFNVAGDAPFYGVTNLCRSIEILKNA